MESASSRLAGFGFTFDPFEYLDSTQDAHLQAYMVIPKAVEIVLSDQPVAIFAQPGGGKSALRIYTETILNDSRGFKFPLTYTPDDYSTDSSYHFGGIRRSLARALFMYLVSYPDLFFDLLSTDKQKINNILLDIPYGLDYNLQALMGSRFVSDLEQILGIRAFSGISGLEQVHMKLAKALQMETPTPEVLTLDECFDTLRHAFKVKSMHVLVDGLDGFIETRSSQALLTWIEPLLSVLEEWDKRNIYLKLFLPMEISEAPLLTDRKVLRAAALTWDDNLLAEVIRRRVFVASGGDFDSLDAISAPDVRNIELILARQLGEKEKLPRQIILKTGHLLKIFIESNKEWISSENLLFNNEVSYVRAII